MRDSVCSLCVLVREDTLGIAHWLERSIVVTFTVSLVRLLEKDFASVGDLGESYWFATFLFICCLSHSNSSNFWTILGDFLVSTVAEAINSKYVSNRGFFTGDGLLNVLLLKGSQSVVGLEFGSSHRALNILVGHASHSCLLKWLASESRVGRHICTSILRWSPTDILKRLTLNGFPGNVLSSSCTNFLFDFISLFEDISSTVIQI